MKKILFILAVFQISLSVTAQTEDDKQESASDLNLLTAPASPGSSLLGFATSDIEKPTELSDLMVSLQTASSSFSKVPSSYAVDFAPFLALGKGVGDISTKGQGSNSHVIPQTFVLSLAVKNTDSTETVLNKESVYGALGFKFSIIRGKYDKVTRKQLNEIHTLQSKKIILLGKVADALVDDSVIDTLLDEKARAESVGDSAKVREIKEKLEKRNGEISAEIDLENKVEIDKIDELLEQVASKFQIARIGWNWDLAGGVSTEFVNKNFSKSRVNNAGIWTTAGFSFEKSGTGLLLARYLYNPDKIFADDNAINDIDDISTFDIGVRYVYGKSQAKLNLSLEAVYRSAMGNTDIDPTWRLAFNADYAIYKNQKLTFSFGRNYDGTTNEDGNLIAALSFIKGFGNKRTVSDN